jgi:predicted outer membrane lipoprotein
MFETTKLAPVYNGYQYLFIFISAMLLDLIIHFFSARKYHAMYNKTDAFGFAPELWIYYRSLAKKGPLSIEGGLDSFNASVNSWLLGALIAGTLGVLTLLLADVFLQVSEMRNN